MPLLKEIDHQRLHQTMLSSLRQSFANQTDDQRQRTVERVQALLERERQRENVGSRSALWKYARTIYGIKPE